MVTAAFVLNFLLAVVLSGGVCVFWCCAACRNEPTPSSVDDAAHHDSREEVVPVDENAISVPNGRPLSPRREPYSPPSYRDTVEAMAAR